jgi:hypothetical protein
MEQWGTKKRGGPMKIVSFIERRQQTGEPDIVPDDKHLEVLPLFHSTAEAS